MWPFRFVAVPVCSRFGLWPFWSVAVPVCGPSGLWPFRFCGRSGLWPFRLWPFRFVAVPVCGRSGFVAVPVCGRSGLWPFRLWPFRFVAVMTCYLQYCCFSDSITIVSKACPHWLNLSTWLFCPVCAKILIGEKSAYSENFVSACLGWFAERYVNYNMGYGDKI